MIMGSFLAERFHIPSLPRLGGCKHSYRPAAIYPTAVSSFSFAPKSYRCCLWRNTSLPIVFFLLVHPMHVLQVYGEKWGSGRACSAAIITYGSSDRTTTTPGLAAQAKLRDQCTIAVWALFTQICKQTSALAH